MSARLDLSVLQTEAQNAKSVSIDRVSTDELCRIINAEDARVAAAVEAQIPIIGRVIDVLVERVRQGGRIFYIGAGTSGRLGVLDASEIPPTYSAPSGQFVGLIAGGDHALRNAIEGAEDDRSGAAADLSPFDLNPQVDSLIGIASSGRTPYVLGGLAYAKSLGCTTVGVVCVEPSKIREEGNADHVIAPVTGPEVVTGSTRMKAGTATKLVLNMISTGVMIRLGKTYSNLMIDVKASNDKLKQRAKNILRSIGGASCAKSDDEFEQLLEQCAGSVKLAAAAMMLHVPVEEASRTLQTHQGVLSQALIEARPESKSNQDKDLVLCVDAGGSSCRAVLRSDDGVVGVGMAGQCNVSSIGVDDAIATISQAVQLAIGAHPRAIGRRIQDVASRFMHARVGIAGYDRPGLPRLVDKALANLLKMPVGRCGLTVTDDIQLLTAVATSMPHTESLIVVVAGTGSVAMSYSRADAADEPFRRTGRVGGWGHLLGDEGSGYAIGREAIRRALRFHEVREIRNSARIDGGEPSRLCEAVVEHFQGGESTADSARGDLLSTILHAGSSTSASASRDAANRIAAVAKVVLGLAREDDESRQIVDAAVSSLVEMVDLLVKSRKIDPSRNGARAGLVPVALVLAGGLMRDADFKDKILAGIKAKCGKIAGQVWIVDEPADAVAKEMIQGNRVGGDLD